MKNTVKRSTSDLLASFYDIRQRKKAIEKEERELRSRIMSVMADEKAMVAGHYLATVKFVTRNTLDKEALANVIGDLSPYTKQTSYTQLDIREV